eukprot:TRINITY_DN877_c0_g1_i1.p1 TRINITY_DN877_c0_g1~~TRINITY_DN877_c0_g1_i1.p1  ORF type:complete len:312 (-),score=85.46 TRINITY_DN877_c0_g1_i1:30-965(-)
MSDHTEKALYYEYTKAADPIGLGVTPPVAQGEFLAEVHQKAGTGIFPFDKSKELQTQWQATSPTLLANYVKILAGESVTTNPNATSEVYYCIKGRGETTANGETIKWKKGDFLTIPGYESVHRAEEDTVFYWVHDQPLLDYLGAKSVQKRFQTTLYPSERCLEELRKAREDPEAKKKSRISVLFANENFPQTRTITHTQWTMFGILPKNSTQLPHRHNSVAIDFIIGCPPKGCYSLMGPELDENGKIKNAIRLDWKAESAFITPPNYWHSHHNETDQDAHLIPMQDAGLQTHLRTLNIEFYQQVHSSEISQ